MRRRPERRSPNERTALPLRSGAPRWSAPVKARLRVDRRRLPRRHERLDERYRERLDERGLHRRMRRRMRTETMPEPGPEVAERRRGYDNNARRVVSRPPEGAAVPRRIAGLIWIRIRR